ncbi:hypothetical protein SAMN02910342_00118 [Butyrivibrio sp. INlla21]|nr:hypothetical protein SAMN02910342_00118 [Butyrivibrio sp. INlla21]
MRFHGFVGFCIQTETAPDVWKPVPSEKEYSGEVLQKTNRSVEVTTSTNDNIVINSRISIVADPYINQHFPSIKYVKWNNNYWEVTSVDQTNYPRIILNLGEVYNGPTVEPEQSTP